MSHRNAEARLPETFLLKTDADARAQRAFWRGVAVCAICLGAVALLVVMIRVMA